MIALVPLLMVSIPAADAPGAVGADGLWMAHVEPLLVRHCLRCHGGEETKGGLDLRTADSLRKGGKRGETFVPGKPDESRLIQFLAPGSKPHMPPGKQLADEEVLILRRWVEGGDMPSPKLPAGTPSPAPAPDGWSPPAGTSPTLAIDLLVEEGWRAAGTSPPPPASDEVFVRRLHLDLLGRIPTRAERETFLAETRSDKRARLVDALLSSPEHARRLREAFEVALLGRAPEGRQRRRGRSSSIEKERRESGWRDYLERSFRENRPWDRVARDLVLGKSEGEARGSSRFFDERRDDHQAMAEATARGLLGVRVECAQCHDHPLAPEIEQRHYWGLVAFLKGPKDLKYATLKGESRPATLTFLDGRGLAPEEAGPETPAPALREKLSGLVSDSAFLPRAMVNRLWALLNGRGLVHPVDRMDSTHPASHPRLLDWLARDFASSGHDVRRLERAIVLSRIYQLESPPHPKPLPAEALHRSLLIAAESPLPGNDETPRVLVDLYPEVFPEEPSIGVEQALFLSNNAFLDELLEPKEGNLAARLLALAEPAAQVEEAFLAILGRRPDDDEAARCRQFLAARADRPRAGVKGLLWALLAGAEFQETR
jgi:mono/diheme cytochrome c family protein